MACRQGSDQGLTISLVPQVSASEIARAFKAADDDRSGLIGVRHCPWPLCVLDRLRARGSAFCLAVRLCVLHHLRG